MKVLFASSEAVPFAKSGGLADVVGALPKALKDKKIDCRIVLPLYASVNAELKAKMKFTGSVTVPVAWRNQYCGVFTAKHNGITYYLLDNEYYFKRDNLYEYYDDAERFVFFSRAVLEILPAISFYPDIIHCNDWQTAMIPVFLREIYSEKSCYQKIKTVFTIHNILYQGEYGKEIFKDVLGLRENTESIMENSGKINLMKGGIVCANRITTVSKTYSQEILYPFFSHGLDGILRDNSHKLLGIINGIDTEKYNSLTDKSIDYNFGVENLSGKVYNKKELLRYFNLREDENAPVIAMVTRLAEHKGIDLVMRVLDDILKENVRFVVLGTGDKGYEDYFNRKRSEYPDKVGVYIGFNEALAHKIYAGSDIFLMPSKSEPCGLSQLIALRYGAIPVVRETGGLKDTVSDSGDNKGNGFTFNDYNAHDMKNSVLRAVEGYKNKIGWDILVKRAMSCDFSWNKSADEYIKIYKELM